MIQNLLKDFNKPVSKYTNNIIKSTTFNHSLPFWANNLKNKNSNLKKILLMEDQINTILKSYLKKTFIIISKPLIFRTSEGLKIKLLYYIPHNYINGKFNKTLNYKQEIPLLQSKKLGEETNIKFNNNTYSLASYAGRRNKTLLTKFNGLKYDYSINNILYLISPRNPGGEEKYNLPKSFSNTNSVDITSNKQNYKINHKNSQLINKILQGLNKYISRIYFHKINWLILNHEKQKIDYSYPSDYKMKNILDSKLSMDYIPKKDQRLISYMKTNDFELKSRIQFISMLLSKIFTLNITIETTRIKYPQLDSTILVEYLGLKSYSWSYSQIKKFIKIIPIKSQRSLINDQLPIHSTGMNPKYLGGEKQNNYSIAYFGRKDSNINLINGYLGNDTFTNKKEKGTELTLNENTKSNLINTPNTSLMGLHLKVAGRLHKQRIVPKKTIKSTNKGPTASNSRLATQIARFNGKNKKGSFSITLRTGHSLKNF